jgi:hypothetical protein
MNAFALTDRIGEFIDHPDHGESFSGRKIRTVRDGRDQSRDAIANK